MNQAILFNDDLSFEVEDKAYRLSGLLAGEIITIFFHSITREYVNEPDVGIQFELEEVVEAWLEKNEPNGNVIHITIA